MRLDFYFMKLVKMKTKRVKSIVKACVILNYSSNKTYKTAELHGVHEMIYYIST